MEREEGERVGMSEIQGVHSLPSAERDCSSSGRRTADCREPGPRAH